MYQCYNFKCIGRTRESRSNGKVKLWRWKGCGKCEGNRNQITFTVGGVSRHYRSTIGRVLAECWSILGWYTTDISANSQLSVGQLSIKCRFRISWYISRYVDQLNLGWVTADITWSTLDLYSTNTQPTLNPLTSVYRLSVDQVLVDVSIEGHLIYWSIVTVDTTYSEHDLQNPDNLIIPKGKGGGEKERPREQGWSP